MGVSVYPPMLVMEMMPRGSVFKILHLDKSKLDWTLTLKMAIGMFGFVIVLYSFF